MPNGMLGGPVEGRVLVIGNDDRLPKMLALLLGPTYRVKSASTAAETEGIGVDVVVVGGTHPVEEYTDVRVHPRLFELPIVLVAPGRTLNARAMQELGAWVVTRGDAGVIDEVVEDVRMLAARARRHPASKALSIANAS